MKRYKIGVGTNQPIEITCYPNGQYDSQLLIPEFINCNMNFKNEKK